MVSVQKIHIPIVIYKGPKKTTIKQSKRKYNGLIYVQNTKRKTNMLQRTKRQALA